MNEAQKTSFELLGSRVEFDEYEPPPRKSVERFSLLGADHDYLARTWFIVAPRMPQEPLSEDAPVLVPPGGLEASGRLP